MYRFAGDDLRLVEAVVAMSMPFSWGISDLL